MIWIWVRARAVRTKSRGKIWLREYSFIVGTQFWLISNQTVSQIREELNKANKFIVCQKKNHRLIYFDLGTNISELGDFLLNEIYINIILIFRWDTRIWHVHSNSVSN